MDITKQLKKETLISTSSPFTSFLPSENPIEAHFREQDQELSRQRQAPPVVTPNPASAAPSYMSFIFHISGISDL
jgi:hypothetical protein